MTTFPVPLCDLEVPESDIEAMTRVWLTVAGVNRHGCPAPRDA